MTDHPADRPGPRPDLVRVERHPGAAEQHRPGPADRTARLHPLLVRRAPSQPRRGRHLPGRRAGADRRRDVDDPARLRRGADGAPHRPVHGRGVRPARRAAPGALRPRSGPLRRPAARAQGTRAGRRRRRGHRGRRPDAERAAHPAPVLHQAAARLAPVRAAEDAAAAAARGAAELHRAGRRRARADRRHLPLPGGGGGPRGTRRGRGAAGLDPRQQRR